FLLIFLLSGALSSYAQSDDFITISIEKSHFSEIGHADSIDVILQNNGSSYLIDELNFVIHFDTSTVYFGSAVPGALFEECQWEKFSFRYTAEGNIYISLKADTLSTDDFSGSYIEGKDGALMKLHFIIKNESALICQYLPVQFLWEDCLDNTAQLFGDSEIFLSDKVFNSFSFYPINEDSEFPTIFGAPDICVDSNNLRKIYFYNGGIDVSCGNSINIRGDVNLNEIAYEIADWVLFSHYFLFRESVFFAGEWGDEGLQMQIDATDCNADNTPLTIDDLIYLLRVALWDALPFPELPFVNSFVIKDTIVCNQDIQSKIVTINYSDSLGGIHIIANGLMVPLDNPYAGHEFDGQFTYIFICNNPSLSWKLPPFDTLFTYSGDGEIIEASFAIDGVTPVHTVLTKNFQQVTIEPDLLNMFDANLIIEDSVVFLLGNFTDYDIEDVSLESIKINNQSIGFSSNIIRHNGFTGHVLKLTLPLPAFLNYYSNIYDTTIESYSVSFNFNDSQEMVINGEVILVGHTRGDLNLDGKISILDLTLLIDYLFNDCYQIKDLNVADLNKSESVNISDLTALINKIFSY
ncbi:MAG: dockerin type I repeat-containing protein, partial [candidate division Zixibacteria bacterium]|nr:dockerin type I repeat-containing protein [candidate division Zixibacteria bacterium]